MIYAFTFQHWVKSPLFTCTVFTYSQYSKFTVFNIQPVGCSEGVWGSYFLIQGPETFRARFGWHNSLFIFKTKAFRGTKICTYSNFYPLYKTWKNQLYKISESEFYEWLFGTYETRGPGRTNNQAKKWVGSSALDISFENDKTFTIS